MPVITNLNKRGGGDSDRQKMQFTLPSSVANPPKPTSSSVKVLTRPEATWAVHRYRGANSREHADDLAVKLKAQLREDGQQIDEREDYEWHRFNPPWTIPPLRTNEIHIRLKD